MNLLHDPADREDLYRPGSELLAWTLIAVGSLLAVGGIIEKGLHTSTGLYMLSFVFIYMGGISTVVLSMDYQQVSKTLKAILFAVASGVFFAPGLLGVSVETLKDDNTQNRNLWDHPGWATKTKTYLFGSTDKIQPALLTVTVLQMLSWALRTLTPSLTILASGLTIFSGTWLASIALRKAKEAFVNYRIISVRIQNNRNENYEEK